MSPSSIARAPLNVVRGCIVAGAPAEIGREVLDSLREEILERIRTTGVRRVLLDLSAVPLMDTEDFRVIRGLAAAARLMGARTVVAGLQPGVVSALVEMGVSEEGFEAALDLDHGLALLEEERSQSDEAPDEADAP